MKFNKFKNQILSAIAFAVLVSSAVAMFPYDHTQQDLSPAAIEATGVLG